MATSFSFDVFLSYNKRDQERVRRLAERLRDAGLRVWFDDWTIKPGDDIYLAIERGLEAARTLALCLSPAALGSDWVGLERSTVLFRDPSNVGRRFIPLLLEDCDLPDTLRRYKYVDFRQGQDEEAALKDLLPACRPDAPPPPEPSVKPQTKAEGTRKLKQPEPLAVLEREFTGHEGWVKSVAISPNGKWAASESWDEAIKIWDLDTGDCSATLEGHAKDMNCVTITPDGKRVLSSLTDGTIRSLELKSGKLTTLKGHSQQVLNLALDRKGRMLVSASTGTYDNAIEIWNIDAEKDLATLQGHSGKVESVQIASDGRLAFSGSRDCTIKIWNLDAGICIGTLEGHNSSVHSLALSPDGSLIASADDRSIRLWDRQTGNCLRVIKADEYDEYSFYPTSVAFSPGGGHLIAGAAVKATNFSLFFFQLAGMEAATQITRRYVNAKVVLVGESGVGKSGLAYRLIEDRFVQTHSTHGMQVWRLDLPLEPEDNLEREALLWDLAGQEDYRLIHQLFLDETSLALMLFNPQEGDPFSEIGVWLKVLRSAVVKDQRREVAKLLIAARTDVGGVKVSQRKIDRYIEEHGLAAYLPTSAKRGDNCSDRRNGGNPSALKTLIAKHIHWNTLPWTSTPRLLADLKNAVIQMKEEHNILLLRFAELVQRLEQALPKIRFGGTEARTAVTLLANHSLVMPLKFGDLILLRPEVLNGYAAAVIRAARDHTDEIGCVQEQAVLDRTIDLEGVERLESADEELLMRAMVQTFLDKSLCIAEDTPEGRHLIFPSQYRRERSIPQHPEIFVSYTFSGEWQTVYTTMVVRLWYSREFKHRELWRNAAEFETGKGRTVGLVMERTGEGEGTIGVFFDTEVPDELKVIFIEYIHRHLEKYATDVRRDRRYVCSRCGRPVADRETVWERLEAKKDFIYCQRCDERVPLIDYIEQRLASDPVARRVLGMNETATRELESQALEQIFIGHMMAICGEANQIFRELTKSDYGIDGEVEFKDNSGAASGKKIYVQLKSGASYLRTRKTDGEEIFDVKDERHLEYWVSQPVDVYLVIRDAEETIRWMNVTRYLKDRPKDQKDSRQIVFEGEKLDAPAVWRVRDRFFGR